MQISRLHKTVQIRRISEAEIGPLLDGKLELSNFAAVRLGERANKKLTRDLILETRLVHCVEGGRL